jgi:hypothetical protein
MVTRLVLKLPWFLSTPTIVAMAIVGALLMHRLAGTYFERSFRDDVDPLAGITVPAPAQSAATPVAAAVASPAPSGASSTAVPPAVAAQAPASPVPATASGGQAAPAQPAAAAPAAPTGPAVLSEGNVVDGDPGHFGKGRARLIRGGDGALTLRFENFSVTNGPDVYVLLSPNPVASRDAARASDALDLGKLKATDGNVNYTVPAGADGAIYRSVIIYCRAFHVIMASAALEAP